MKKFLKQMLAMLLSCLMLFSGACTTINNGTSSQNSSSSLNSTNSSSTSSSSSSSSQEESSISSAISSSSANSSSSSQGGSSEQEDINKYIINQSSVPLTLQYDCEAPILSTENNPVGTSSGTIVADDSWEEWSLPIGNGYFGANIFGRTETERVQISEKTLTNPNEYINGNSVGGLNNFSETYIDFNHDSNNSTNYRRYLDLKTAISGVEYTYNGVKYTREYFTSYPDKVLVIKLNASTENALSFTLRPTIPYEQDYMTKPGDNISKHGTVTSKVENGIGEIELSGKMGFYDIDFLGLYKVYTNGGTMSASTTAHTYTDTAGTSHTDTDGTIVVENATSAYIVLALGTDYEFDSATFTADAELNNCLNNEKMETYDPTRPTFKTGLDYTRSKVEKDMASVQQLIAGTSYNEAYWLLKDRHIQDYSNLFNRVSLDLSCDANDYELTTDELLNRYSNGTKSNYLELLLFQYGRYMLIASSREGSLPNHLQGVWNTYNSAPWSCNYTHNINVQMNYWPAFSTNLAETFEAYIDYNTAYMEAAEKWADLAIIWNGFGDLYDKDGGNGWVVGHAANPYKVTYDASPGNLGFTTQIFWEYYQYTQDKQKLEEVIYPILYSAAQFITKMVVKDENGNYLVAKCDSPEQYVNGQWYYTSGTAYAQSFSYLNNYNLLLAAKELGIDLTDNTVLSQQENAVLKTVLEQIDKYDPIIVGLSGQIKEFREEEYYGDLGEWKHRHISQLVGLFPGNLINGTTPAWIDATKVTLTERGFDGVGWSAAHKICLWARTKDGDTAHSILQNLLGNGCIAPNLWDLYFGGVQSTFQIEGNFGATAGMTEFLLQSDAGYIEPLASLPNAWATGTYTGLVARGNFEVSVDWQNGLAKSLNILSKAGKDAYVYYPSITNAVVRTINGDIVNYTVEGNNLIKFETQVGETYVIYGFTSQDKLSAPQNLTYTRQGLGEFNLSWNTVENAESYNVYVAIESQADYTLVGKVQGTTFSYLPSQQNLNARITFVVTATAENYTESNRTLCYYDPNTFSKNNILQGKEFVGAKGTEYDTSNDLDFSYAKLTDGDFAQDYGADNWKYGRYSSLVNGYADATIDLLGSYILTEIRFYCFSGDTARIGTNFTLQVLSNGTWVDVYKNLSNEQLKTHFVNKGSANTTKYIKLDLGAIVAQKIRFYSQALSSNTVTLYEIECSGEEVYLGSKNILINKTFIGAPGTGTTQDEHTSYDYTKLTDGIIDIDVWYNGRFSSTFNGFADGTVDLGETYNLTEVRFYCYQGELYRAGTNFTLQVYYNGEWIDIVKNLTNEQLDAYVLKNGSTAKNTWISFGLNGIKAEKIRFYSEATTGNTVTLYEIECSGYIEK